MLIDSHTHLNDRRFSNDMDTVIKSLRQNGVEAVLNCGYDLESSITSVDMANKYDLIYAAVGTHPHDVKDMSVDTLREYERLSKDKKVLAIGEIGLDYYYDNSPRDIQKNWFRGQIRLAKSLDLPYIVHDRDAHEDVFTIMKEEHYSGARGILHCFSGSAELAKEFIKLGFMISLAGPLTFKNAKAAKRVAYEIPLEYLLIETDCPYLAPEPYRGKRNEPMYVRHVAEEIAKIKEISYEEVEEKTNYNFKKLFDLV